nr:sugar phosphate nucleotidyltransferase [Thermus aquaticus]
MVPSYAVILAGGKGERFWPLSTPERPKPFLKLFGERSLLQATGERLLGVVSRILWVKHGRRNGRRGA